jgi:hypothetical protein
MTERNDGDKKKPASVKVTRALKCQERPLGYSIST